MQELTTENYYVTNYLGTIIPSNLFKKYIIKASYLINHFTSHRIKVTNSDIQNACCEISEILYTQDKLYEKVMNTDERLASETVGPHSRTFINNSNLQNEKILSSGELEKECYKVCLKHLAHTGLMYRGGC